MSVNYNQAMHELQSMFADLDERTIRKVLEKYDGNIEPSIDELLRIQENGGNAGNSNQDFGYDDNMFAANSRSNSNNYGNQRNNNLGFDDNFGNFGGSNTNNRPSNGGNRNNSGSPNRDPYGLSGGNAFGGEIDREEQERIDAEMAYNLQKEYMAQDQAVEQQLRSELNSQQYVQQPGQNRGYPSGSNAAVVSAQGEKKKKKGVLSKISGGFKKIFTKNGKNKGGNTGGTGKYADIDEVGDNEPMYPISNDHNDAPGLGSFNNNAFGNSNNNYNLGGDNYSNNNNNNNNNFGSRNNNNNNDFDGNIGGYSNHNNSNNARNNVQQREEEEDEPMQLDDILNQRGLNNNKNATNVNANHFDF